MRFIGLLSATGLLTLILPRLITAIYAGTRLYSVKTVPVNRIAIVFELGYGETVPQPRCCAIVLLPQRNCISTEK